jgi:hypothetical protein
VHWHLSANAAEMPMASNGTPVEERYRAFRCTASPSTTYAGSALLCSYCGGIVRSVPRGRPSPKLAITVDPDIHEQVLEAAEAEGVSVSAWMTSAARRALLVRDGLDAVAAWESEHGALTEPELATARRRVAAQVGAAAPRQRRRPA